MNKLAKCFLAANYFCIGFSLSQIMNGSALAWIPIPINIIAIVLLSHNN